MTTVLGSRLLRRLAALVPAVVASFALPVAGPVTPSAPPSIRHDAVPLAGAGRYDALSGATSVKAPFAFSLAAITFERSGRVPVAVDVRTSADGRHWSPWTRLATTPDEGPDTTSRERSTSVSTEPVWAPGSRFVQVRDGESGPGYRRPGARLHVVDPGATGPRWSPRSARAAVTQPAIVTRQEWGADESIRRVAKHDVAHRVRMAFVHHTATANDYGEADAPAIVRSIYAFHVKTNGWDDIGYNFLVDRFGRIYEGRFGGIEKAIIGAHTSGFNTASTGVAVIGSYGGQAPASEATDALRRLLTWKLDVHHVDPRASVTMRSGGSNKYPEGAHAEFRALAGHRDAVNTDCPGDVLYSLLEGMRAPIADAERPKIFDPAPRHPIAFTPNGDGHADSVTATATAAGATTWRAELKDPNGTAVGSGSGAGEGISHTWDGTVGTERGGHGVYPLTLSASDSSGTAARDATIPFLLAAWPDGSVVRPTDGGTVFRVEGGTLRPFASPSEFLNTYRWSEVAGVTPSVRSAYRQGARPGYRDGTLLRTPGGAVWLVTNGVRRSFNSTADFLRLGYRWDAILDVSADEAGVHQAGPPLDAAAAQHADGTLVRGSGPAVYWLRAGLRRPIPSAVVFDTWSFRWIEVVGVSDAELSSYADGEQVTFRDGTLLRVKGDPAVYVIEAGRRRPIPSVKTFDALGLRWDNVREVPAFDAATAPVGKQI